MANYRLSGYTTQASVDVPDTDSLGNVLSMSTSTPFNSTQWNRVRTAGADTLSLTSNTLTVSASRVESGGSFLFAQRAFLQFAIPNNLSRLDATPHLFLNVDDSSGTTRIVPTSVNTTNIKVPWDTTTSTNAFQSVQVSDSAKYISNASVTVASGENTISLNELAKFHVLFGGNVSSGTRYLTIAIVEYTYDWTDTLPGAGVTNTITFDNKLMSDPPRLILNKPWFIDDKGAEFPVAGDYTIRAFNVDVNQRDRSVPQLPFSTAIKGPAYLRGKNVPYKVTS